MRRVCSRIAIVCVVVLLAISAISCGNNNDNKSIQKYDEASMKAGKYINSGGVYSLGATANDAGLAVIIYNTTTKLDKNNGGDGVHISNSNNREKYYQILKITIDKSDDFKIKKETVFAYDFEHEFGKLPRTVKGAPYPDIANDDDDFDGIKDWLDDDDDNDGCMDWDELDDNIGGKGNEYNESDYGEGMGATGFGRGDGPNDNGERNNETPGENDSKNPANGSDTSHLDDGM